jgi:hypothetical protein
MKVTIKTNTMTNTMKYTSVIFNSFIAMCGYTIHHSVLWCAVDWAFAPITLVYWLITHKLTLSVLEQTFTWFFH